MFFNKPLNEKNEIFSNLRSEHAVWKDELYRMNKPFFMIPNDFSHLFLKNISGGALKLYLFLGFHSKYKTGESWYSVEQLSLFFEKDERTISKWFAELERLNLIYRGQKGFMMKSNTFLKPYGIFFEDDEIYHNTAPIQIENYIKESRENISFAIIFNNGIDESTLVLLKQDKNNQNLYSGTCFIDIGFEHTKKIKRFSERMGINCQSSDLELPLSKSSNLKQTIYSSIVSHLDKVTMWE